MLAVQQPDPAATQRVGEIAAKAAQRVNQDKTGWTMEREYNHIGVATQRWKKAGGHRMEVQISCYKSVEEADRQFQLKVSLVPRGVPEQLEGLGDKAVQILKLNGSGGSITIRKGAFLIIIRGTSLESAHSFARHVVDSIDEK